MPGDYTGEHCSVFDCSNTLVASFAVAGPDKVARWFACANHRDELEAVWETAMTHLPNAKVQRMNEERSR